MVDTPYQVFVATDGTALEGGRIFIGAPNADPETSPIALFWDAALTIPAAQPLRTSGGIITNAGAPAEVFAAQSTYSIRVRDRGGSLVWFKPITGGDLSASRLSFPIPTGPASVVPGPSNNTRVDLVALKAAAITDVTSLYDGSLWSWTLGDFTGRADDLNIVKADSTALSTGAWVRPTPGMSADRSAAQGAIAAAQGTQGGKVEVARAIGHTAPVTVDRMVDTTIGDLVVSGSALGGGFAVPNATAVLFDSSLSVTLDPMSESVRFSDLLVQGASASAAAYLISSKFLRYSVTGCRFEKMKLVNSSIYLQSVRITDTSFWRWAGKVVDTAGSLYDFTLLNSRFEKGGQGVEAGYAFGARLAFNLFEGSTGPFLKIDGGNAVCIVGNYTEGNTSADYILTDVAGAGVARGVLFAGQLIAAPPAGPTVVVGDVRGGLAAGNYSAGDLYDVSATRTGHFVSIGDFAVGAKFSDNRFWEGTAAGIAPLTPALTAKAGGGQSGATQLVKPVNRVTVCATANDSVALPSTDDIMYGDYAKFVMVANDGAADLAVHYKASDTSNWSSPTGILSVIPPGQARVFLCTYRGLWSVVGGLQSDTGWTAGTGAQNKGAFASYAGQTIGATYDQTALQAMDDALKAASQRVLALEATLRKQKAPN